MTKKLERDLGLLEVTTISIGAMVGSGIFILPALAVGLAGPAVILAYLLAGVLVLPAALSKAEMATAIPEAGGTYIFVERALGPFIGTIAGVGTWFSLTFKAALALVGGVPYLVLLFDLPVKPVAITLTVVLIVINILGTKHTGRLQNWIVTVMLAAIAWFIYQSRGYIDTAHFAGFWDGGAGGLLAATGLVFVSYAGVTKIASVAEEIENPGRVIPRGMLGSLAFTTILYVLMVAVMVGVLGPEQLADTLTPAADAAEAALGSTGVLAVVIAALLALVSTANAGLLSASRYPLAMARDALMPIRLSAVSGRFTTPIEAITLTGGVMLVLIVFVPILEIAKLASAFKILVFAMINVAVIALREGDIEGYEPEFRSPLYPWMQIFGIVTAAILLTYMGVIAIAGAVLIIIGSSAWYLLWARSRVNREGAATQVVRKSVRNRIIEDTRVALEEKQAFRVLVALQPGTAMEEERDLLRIAASIAGPQDGDVEVMQFDTVPGQVPLDFVVDRQTPDDEQFEQEMKTITEETGIQATYGEVAAHDPRHAVVNYAEHRGVDLILMPREPQHIRDRLGGSDEEWIMRRAPCHVLLVEDRGMETVDEIAVVTNRGGYEPTKIQIANALAEELDASIRLVFPDTGEHTPSKEEDVQTYHDEIAALCTVPVSHTIVAWGDRYEGVASELTSADLVIISINGGRFRNVLFGRPEAHLVDTVSSTTVEFHTHPARRGGILERFLERLVF